MHSRVKTQSEAESLLDNSYRFGHIGFSDSRVWAMTVSFRCECNRPSGTGPYFEKLLHRVDINGPGGQVASPRFNVTM